MNLNKKLSSLKKNKRNAYNEKLSSNVTLKLLKKDEIKILRVILLEYLHSFFCELFHESLHDDQYNFLLESYSMDNKIIQILINRIVESSEYTLEGISYHTRIPFDVIFDAVNGKQNQFSVTLWVKVANLFLQINPNIRKQFFEKLISIGKENQTALYLLLNEQ